jgi:hypothetical protein
MLRQPAGPWRRLDIDTGRLARYLGAGRKWRTREDEAGHSYVIVCNM